MSARKITIEPVTRIEGHARVTIIMNDAGEVEKALMHVDEFRGLEKFTEGRPYFEMPQITQRICGICPVSHHLASAKACDQVAGTPPPRPAVLLRDLMHSAQMVQSHGMHFFHLAAPDLVFGFDADPQTRNVFGIIRANPELAKKAVNLRRFGQQIIERLGQKRIHPNFAVSGGVNTPLTTADRDAIAAESDAQIAFAQAAIGICRDWLEQNAALAAQFAVFPSNYLGLTNADNSLELFDGNLRFIDPEGNFISRFRASDYLDYIGEYVENWSFLKFPFYRQLGREKGMYRVGPLARINIAKTASTPLTQAELNRFKQLNGGKPVEGSLYYHYARLIELLFALEHIRELLDDPDILSHDVRQPPLTHVTGHGVGVIEAPRGTLIHDYTTDENGILTRVNLIVATGHNNWAMNKAVEAVAKIFVKGREIAEGMLNRVEAAIRCYDPCFSCSTHALGQMRLSVRLVDAEGALLDRVDR